MKRVKLLVMLVTLFQYSFAQMNIDATIAHSVSATLMQPDDQELKFKLGVLNPSKEKLTIHVIDKSIGILTTNHTSSVEYSILYDMRDLPDGTYYIEIKSASSKISKQVIINTVVSETRTAAISDKRKLLGF